MDVGSLGFLLLILAVSGFIAFQADKLGKKLGKKRLSLFGLRPRHVAALGTVLLGVFVSLLTILFVMAASKETRQWLIEGRQLIIQRDALQKRVKELRLSQEAGEIKSRDLARKLNFEQSQLKAIETLNKRLSDANANLIKQRDQYVAQRDRMKSQVDQLSGRLAALSGRLRTAESELAKGRLALKAMETRRAMAYKAWQKAYKDWQTARSQYEVADSQFKDANDKKNEALKENLKLDSDNQSLRAQVARWSDDATRLKDDVDKLTEQRKEAESQLDLASKQLDLVTAQLNSTSKDLAELQDYAERQRSFLASTFMASRTESMTYRRGEEVARVVVPAGTDLEGAQRALTGLLRTARVEAEARGAKGHQANGHDYAVADIFDRQDPQTGVDVPSSALKRSVINQAAARVDDQVLVATSSLNAFVGEPVSLDVTVYPNPIVYHRNDVVGEVRIDGALPEGQIMQKLSDFLATQIQKRATDDRMIPRARSAAPFGEVPANDVLTLVRDIKRVGRSVRVQALVSEETRAAEPLRLGFRLR